MYRWRGQRARGAPLAAVSGVRPRPSHAARCTDAPSALAAPGPAHVHSLPHLSLLSATWTDLLHCLRRRTSPAHTSKLRMSCTRLYPITYTTALFIYLASSTRDVACTSQSFRLIIKTKRQTTYTHTTFDSVNPCVEFVLSQNMESHTE